MTRRPPRPLASRLAILALVAACQLAPTALAQAPQTIAYQGFITNGAGVPVNGSVNVTFRLYTAASGGSPVWSETQSGVGVANGVLNTALGNAVPLSIPFNVPYYLSIQVNSDAEMSPRQPLAAVPYAMRAAAIDSTATIPATQISGTIAANQLPATQLLPTTACAANQVAQWSGTAWACAASGAGAQGPVGPQGPAGPAGPQGPAGPAGSVSAATNLTLPAVSTASAGIIYKGTTPFIHSFGTSNSFLGEGAGNLSMIGPGNTAMGNGAMNNNANGFGNTAVGEGVMFSNTSGYRNVGVGGSVLMFNGTGGDNVALGYSALTNMTAGDANIAVGKSAGSALTTGSSNIYLGNGGAASESGVIRIGTDGVHGGTYLAGVRGADIGRNVAGVGVNEHGQLGTAGALQVTSASGNTALGYLALGANTSGAPSTAVGHLALSSNTDGSWNSALGSQALQLNTSGWENTALGGGALLGNTTGNRNTAVGYVALGKNTAGDNNIAIGYRAGNNTTGSNNVMIGNAGVAAEDNTIRIGQTHTRFFVTGVRGGTTEAANAIPVLIDSQGQLGTASSSRRFKDTITDMDAASSALMKLRPVTFHYKTDQNPAGRSLQYGLIAEEVAEVYPGLVAHSADGQIETVMYQFLPPMMLNEMQKQQRSIEALQSQVSDKDREIDALKRDLATIKRKLGMD